jgi:hypothetical protein
MNTRNENCTVQRDEGQCDHVSDNDSTGQYLGLSQISHIRSDR